MGYSGLLLWASGTENDAALTPVMRQYFAAKEAHPDCLMFCRIGDFYELFYEGRHPGSARAATDADGARS